MRGNRAAAEKAMNEAQRVAELAFNKQMQLAPRILRGS